MDWSVLNSLPTIEEQLNYFNDTLIIGLNSMMPIKTCLIASKSHPWMTPYLKDLIHHRKKP